MSSLPAFGTAQLILIVLWLGCLALCFWYARGMGLIELLIIILIVLLLVGGLGARRW